jgi:type II secretory pathway component PulC
MRTYLYKSLTLIFLLCACAAAYWSKVLVPAEIARIENKKPETWIPSMSETGEVTELSVASSQDVLQSVDEFLARPLFLSSRRPFVPPAPPDTKDAPVELAAVQTLPTPPPVPTVDPSTFLLKGIVIDGGYREALVVTATNPTPRWYSAGSRVEGWEVAAINDNEIVLMNGSNEVRLKQYVDKENPSVAATGTQ